LFPFSRSAFIQEVIEEAKRFKKEKLIEELLKHAAQLIH
jgi:hypothetical protein